MAGTTPVHHSSISYFQGWDIRGRLHSGRSHLTDDSGIINSCEIVFMTMARIKETLEFLETTSFLLL